MLPFFEHVGPCKCKYIKPTKLLVVRSGNMIQNWERWLQQYELFEIVTQMKSKAASVQVAAFLLSIDEEAIIIFNSFHLSETELADVEAIKTRFHNFFTLNERVEVDREWCKSELTLERSKKKEGPSENTIIGAIKTTKDKNVSSSVEQVNEIVDEIESSDEISVSDLLHSLSELKKLLVFDTVLSCMLTYPRSKFTSG